MLPPAFERISDELDMVYRFFDSQKKTKVAIFCSRTLHCPLEIISRQLSGALHTEIAYIISNESAIKRIAEIFSIPFFYTPTRNGSLAHKSRQIEILKKAPVELVALARYMKVLSKDFLIQASSPVINIHHSFLPSFIGGRPYEMAYKRGVKIIGATAHFVTQALDEGPIISQDVLPIDHSFSIDSKVPDVIADIQWVDIRDDQAEQRLLRGLSRATGLILPVKEPAEMAADVRHWGGGSFWHWI